MVVSPKRIQRKRVKGWRMPEGAVYVGRPTQWGNPHPIGPWTREQAVNKFRYDVEWGLGRVPWPAEIRAALAGKDLVCWCPLDQPCHADVLLEIANDAAVGETL